MLNSIDPQFIVEAFLQSPGLLALAIIVCTFILEDPTTLSVGYFIAIGKIDFTLGLASLFTGIFLGDLGLFYLGKFANSKISKRLERLKKLMLNSFSIFYARFIPGMRVTYYPLAGIQGVNLTTFIIPNIISSVIWTVMLLKASMFFSESFIMSFKQHKTEILLGLIVFVMIIEFIIRKLVLKKIANKKFGNTPNA